MRRSLIKVLLISIFIPLAIDSISVILGCQKLILIELINLQVTVIRTFFVEMSHMKTMGHVVLLVREIVVTVGLDKPKATLSHAIGPETF
jgi:hypothetical protein